MIFSTVEDAVPLWILFILTTAIVLISTEVGWRLGNLRRQRAREERKAPVSAAVGTTLGLLAFLLAFTFGMAATRYDTRKNNVLLEANAIGTTYLRADLLPEGSRYEVRRLLLEYTQLRAGGRAAIMSLQGMKKSADLQDQIWAIAASAVEAQDTISSGLFIQSLNQMIDLDAVRITGLRNRIPDTIWLMLIVVTIFSMAGLGYQFGLTGTHSWTVTILMAIAFTAVIWLIIDLDRPQSGLVQVSQQPLLDLLDRFGAPMP